MMSGPRTKCVVCDAPLASWRSRTRSRRCCRRLACARRAAGATGRRVFMRAEPPVT